MVVPRIIKKSAAIITVSHFEKNRIGDFFGMKDDPRLKVVYNGVGKHFKPVTDVSELSRVKALYELPDRFFFFLGNTDPKKNTDFMCIIISFTANMQSRFAFAHQKSGNGIRNSL